MTLAACGMLYWPSASMLLVPNTRASTLGANSILMDADTDRLAWVGMMPPHTTSDTLAKVYFRTNTVTTGTNVTLKVQIESVTNGKPSGTIYATGASGTLAMADADDNKWNTVTIGTPPVIPTGDLFAIVITKDSGAATPSINFAGTRAGELYGDRGQFPIALSDLVGATWIELLSNLEWIVELTTDGVIYLPGLSPLNGTGTITAWSNSAGQERALKAVPPMKCRCIGIRAAMYNLAAGSNYSLSLWPSSSSVDGDALGQVAVDGDFPIATTTDGYADFYFATPVTLTAGSTYYAGLRPDTANNIGLGELTTATVTNAQRAFGIGLMTANLSTRTWTTGTAGAWSDTAGTLPLICLILDQLDDGASAGGTGFMMV